MSILKIVNMDTWEKNLTSVADSIRDVTGKENTLEWPIDYINEINPLLTTDDFMDLNIPSGRLICNNSNAYFPGY